MVAAKFITLLPTLWTIFMYDIYLILRFEIRDFLCILVSEIKIDSYNGQV